MIYPVLIICVCNICSSSAGSKRIFLLHIFKEPVLGRKMHKEVSFHYGRKYFNFLQQKSTYMYICKSFEGGGGGRKREPPFMCTICILYVQVSPILMIKLSNSDIKFLLIFNCPWLGFILQEGVYITLPSELHAHCLCMMHVLHI